MAGRRPLTSREQRKLLRVVRRLSPRDRSLLTTQWMTGLRVSEVLSLTVTAVWREGKWLPRIGVAPRQLKGGYGRTRYIPILPELRRALERQLNWLDRTFGLKPDLPLFPSRQHPGGVIRSITRVQAHTIVKTAFARAGIVDDGRLGCHSLRKTWARTVYRSAGNDLVVLKAALGHADVAVTQAYLDVGEDAVAAAISRCDFTRGPRIRRFPVALPAPAPIPAPLSTAA